MAPHVTDGGQIESWHGKPSGYTVRKCRCAECRSGWARAYHVYRRRRVAAGICIECSLRTVRGVRCERHRLRHNANVAIRKARAKARAREATPHV